MVYYILRGGIMEKVFDVEKFAEDLKDSGYERKQIDEDIERWAGQLQGLTQEEISKMGFGVHPNWLIEKEVE